MSELDINQLMADSAKDAISFAQTNFQIELDGSPASLSKVDEIIGKIDVDEVSDEDLFTISYMLGAYVGQIFITQAGGSWVHLEQTEHEPPQTFVQKGQLTIAFPGKVYRSLMGTDQQLICEYYTDLVVQQD